MQERSQQPELPTAPGWRLAVDTGGTFTDVVAMDRNGRIVVHKLLSSPSDYSHAIVGGASKVLSDNDIPAAGVRLFVHATTVATNAILAHKGARTAVVTTRGFRDVLEMRRLSMPRLYDLNYAKPPPLAPRELRFEVDERVDHRGEVVRMLDEGSVAAVRDEMLSAGVESVAVALLHSYANPTHELRVAELLAEASDWGISTSSTILPQIEEYRRTSTATINAYVKPVVSRYLESLEQRLRPLGIEAQILVMQSNGGVMSADLAHEMPAMIVESGPAAGVVGAQKLAGSIGVPDLITFDMGGTTAKASLIERGGIMHTAEYEVGAGVSSSSILDLGRGYLLGVPAISIAEVGAGGGSVAWIDAGGVMQVGPHSAGARPGPVGYGLGGQDPTVTDANLILGYLNPSQLAGGGIQVDIELCRDVLTRKLARPLRMTLEEAALGVHRIANANMKKALRAVTVERGRDPSQFSMLAFGGSGPVHGATLAEELKIREVIVPSAAGLFSAFGLLFADLTHHVTQTYFHRLGDVDWAELARAVEQLRARASEVLAAQHAAGREVSIVVSGDVRYVGQTHELQVPLSEAADRLRDRDAVTRAFTDEYEIRYGHSLPGAELEVVNLRATATLPRAAEVEWPRFSHSDRSDDTRRCFFADEGFVTSAVIGRSALGAGPVPGPAVIEEYDSTTVVPPGWTAALDRHGNIRLRFKEEQ